MAAKKNHRYGPALIRWLGLALVLVLALAGFTLVLGKPLAKDPAPGSHLIWSDEFNGPAGQPPDPAKWNLDLGNEGWGNNEWEYYTRRPDNATQDGAGHLQLIARRPDVRPEQHCVVGPCDITSARLQTDGTFSAAYGRFEARLKLPRGQGLWPAFWMLPTQGEGEIDIMENGGDQVSKVSGTLHGPGYAGADGLSREYVFPAGQSAADSFHTYAVDWTPQQITWSVDGHNYQTVTKSAVAPHPWVFDHPFYLLLNLAVGSDSVGYPDSSTVFPAELVVDYVRVYQFTGEKR